MKKIFAFTISMLILLFCFSIQAKGATTTINTSEEDMLIDVIAKDIDKSCITDSISYSFAGIDLEEVDYNIFMQKLQNVIDEYNESHNLQIEITTKIFEERYLQINVRSTNSEKIVTYVGQLAHLELSETMEVSYWESSEHFGSGKCGMITMDNDYVSNDLIVEVNGVAYLDDDGNIVSSYYNTIQIIDTERDYMVHISSNGRDLGWVMPTYLTLTE